MATVTATSAAGWTLAWNLSDQANRGIEDFWADVPDSSAAVEAFGDFIRLSGISVAGSQKSQWLELTKETITGIVWKLNDTTVLSVSGISVDLSQTAEISFRELFALSDFIALSGGNDSADGYSGNDRIEGGPGSDSLDGGDGIDTAIFEKVRSAYKTEKLSQDGITLWKVTDLATGDVDELRNIEKLEFAKASVAGYQNPVQTEVSLDVTGTPAVTYRLYRAAFARDPDLGGLGFWVSLLQQYLNPSLSPEQNPFLLEVAKNFVESAEFKAKYGADVDNATYIRNLYKNALGRDPDEGGFNWWKANLDAGYTYRQHMLVFFSESEENKAAIEPIIATGVEYVPWVPPGA